MLSWDNEHYLATGSVKFGLLAEMLKNQNRITLYEQIQTRLGGKRNNTDIIPLIVNLLDGINEETIYNKISESWDAVINMKKVPGQSLNEFFSKFETLHYSLNAADHSYQDPGPMEIGREQEYYEDREKLILEKIEVNDKLKAVMLIKALDIDSAFKRDILAKVDFSREPNDVYETTKIAIRDICSESINQTSNSNYIVKPWKENNSELKHFKPKYDRYPSNERPRSYSRERNRGYSYNSERDGSFYKGKRERSFSRGRDKDSRDQSRGSYRRSSRQREDRGGQLSVSFRKRDITPAAGMKNVILIEKCYDQIFSSDSFGRLQSKISGQFIIVDSGCPRSLMGRN